MKTPTAGAVRRPTDKQQQQLDTLNPPVYPEFGKIEEAKTRPGQFAQTTLKVGKTS